MTGRTNITRIVDLFGGQTALAKALGTKQSTVWEWTRKGTVPSSRIPEIIRAGAEQHPPINLQPNDFFDMRAA